MKLLETLLDRAVAVIPEPLRDKVVVFGSAPMVLAGLKPDVSDLDFFVSDETFAAMEHAGFPTEEMKPGVSHVVLAEQVEAYCTWAGVEFPDVLSASKPSERARGLRVASLEHVLAYKRAIGRPKDVTDAAVLERVLADQPNRPAK